MPSVTSNPNYVCTVTKGGTSGLAGSTGGLLSSSAGGAGGSVTGNAMAKLSVAIENKWVNIMEAIGLSGGGSGLGAAVADVANIALLATGSNFLPQIATSHVWRGSSGIELSVEMRFDAVDDTVQDVLVPIQTLIQMFSPTRGGSTGVGTAAGAIATAFGATGATAAQITAAVNNTFMHPPGPTPYEYITGAAADQSFTVQLGNVMMITNLIPTSLQWEFENRYADSGDPIAAMVRLGFISFTIPAQDEILAFFMNQQVFGGNTGTDPVAGTQIPPGNTNVANLPDGSFGGGSPTPSVF